MLKVVALAGAVLLTGGLAACSAGSTGTGGGAATAEPTPLTSAAFAAPAASGAQPTAITYQPVLVPPGAQATVAAVANDGGTTITLTVSGLLSNHMYGAHVHTRRCGVKPADSGPHYQNTKDPVQPSVDPAYANAHNEVWLDFLTDATGGARVTARTAWTFRPGGANAVVLHAEHSHTEAGKAGTAGARLACVGVTFG